jgi:cytochrome P450
MTEVDATRAEAAGTDTDATEIEVSDAEAAAGLQQYVRACVLPWTADEFAARRASSSPQEMYVDLHAKCPVLHPEDGVVSLLRMEDIVYVNKHRGVEQGTKYLGSNRPAIPLGLDGPLHRKYRRLLNPVFTAARIDPFGDDVRQIANELIDGFIADGETDVFHRWCELLPARMFLRIMGIPDSDLEHFLEFNELTMGNEKFAHLTPEEMQVKRNEAIAWIQDYVDRSMAERTLRGDPGTDVLGALMTSEVDGDRLSRQNIHDIFGLLIIGGLDTVAAALACMLSYLARHPEQREQLVANPGMWPRAVEELMRFEAPTTDGARVALEDLELPSGEVLPAGTLIGMSWSAANMDPTFWDGPLAVDFDRTPNPHAGFATGFHRCLGSHLARMEMHVALEVWHQRIPAYQIKPGVELVYNGNPRAPRNFPLVWDVSS